MKSCSGASKINGEGCCGADERRARTGMVGRRRGGDEVSEALVIPPMAPPMFRHLGLAPSLGSLNRERRRVDPLFMLELEKEPISSRRRDFHPERNDLG